MSKAVISFKAAETRDRLAKESKWTDFKGNHFIYHEETAFKDGFDHGYVEAKAEVQHQLENQANALQAQYEKILSYERQLGIKQGLRDA